MSAPGSERRKQAFLTVLIVLTTSLAAGAFKAAICQAGGMSWGETINESFEVFGQTVTVFSVCVLIYYMIKKDSP